MRADCGCGWSDLSKGPNAKFCDDAPLDAAAVVNASLRGCAENECYRR